MARWNNQINTLGTEGAYEAEEGKISKINAAGLINITLEQLWKDAYAAMAKNNFRLWNVKLDAIWCILGGDIEEGKDEDIKFNEMELKLYKTGSLNHTKEGFGTHKDEDKNTIALQYLLLRKKTIFLRRLQNSQGKGTAYAEGGDDEDWE
jgi:hypothetical protein